ncbi:metalloproteinase inhibitor 4 isoform X2 [Phyllostomus hastatus]|uniref:metalloproteinase inhibitor 4 isoform X2 n=1 Tax=Phyllostomus hastatus TaxID=9423 RepID=UPI001E6814B0|nr:metalloproteinase inhibitor 4 isoform X2 [Phyllostomus hastatus]
MPRSPQTVRSWALLLRLLALLRPPGLGEACSCAPAHPQQHVCHSALVIRAKISSEKMFKGFEKVKDVQYIYTPFDSSLCGVKLEANSQKQYILTGQVLNDGKVFIHLCNYIEPWENLSFLQRESLNHHYHLNCGCQITTCYTVPCTIAAPNECLWTDWLLERKLYGYQAQHYVCMKHVDGTCSWYEGHLPLRKEFIDIIQP